MNELLSAYKSATARLQAARGKHKVIAAKIGKTPAWVSMIAGEKILDPGINAIAMLIDALDELEASGVIEPLRASSVGQAIDEKEVKSLDGNDKPRVFRRVVGRDFEQVGVGL